MATEYGELHNRDKGMAMNDMVLIEMQNIVRRAAQPCEPGDSIKALINRAARRMGLQFRRARSIWYATPGTAIRAAEADALRVAELRLLTAERIRLETQMRWIETRLGAAHEQNVRKESRSVLDKGDEVRSEAGGLVGEAGTIDDQRQGALL